MKKTIVLLAALILNAVEPLSVLQETPVQKAIAELPTENPSKLLYVAGGTTIIMPTVSLGCRMFYHSSASDISVAGIWFIGQPLVVPSIQYRQLYFPKKTWADLKKKGDWAFYYGAKTDAYWIRRIPLIFDLGVVVGGQIKSKNGGNFLELGFCPFVTEQFQRRHGEVVFAVPFNISLSYALSF